MILIDKFISLYSLKNKYIDKECIIVGNGPSVNLNDLKKIQKSGKIIFVFNRFYLAYKQLELDFFHPDFIISIDPQMINDFGQEIVDNKHDATVIFGSNRFKKIKGNFIQFTLKHRIPFKFISKPLYRISTGDSVVIATIQLAYYMGMKNIYLYGIDHNFNYENIYNDGMVDGDENHFIKNYRDGKKWHPPVSENIDQAFIECDKFLRDKRGFIINCSRKTKLENIERGSLDDCL